MSKLAEKLRKAREIRVELAPGKVLVARRPTDLEWHELSNGVAKDILCYVVGWEGITESDLVAGGDPHPIAFDADACKEWLADSPKEFGAVITAVVESYKAHSSALDEAEKN